MTKKIPFIYLIIGEAQTSFEIFTDSKEDSSKSYLVNIGYEDVSNRFFKKFPPTYDEVDYAINYTEELIVPLHNSIDSNMLLYSNDSHLKEVASIAFNTYTDENGFLTLPTVELESVFNRLSDIIKGLPASQDVIPQDNKFAAYMLILREILHHLYFKAIKIA